jgi:release factor glutamine methyltransferase
VVAASSPRVPDVAVYAVDVDPAAAECARRNLRRPERVLVGDLFEPLPGDLRGRVAVVTANAPYVPTGALGTMPAEARMHEPRVALDGGADGTGVQARIVAAAADWLAPTGALLIETGRDLAAGTAGLIRAATGPALTVTTLWDDDLEATVVAGERPG